MANEGSPDPDAQDGDDRIKREPEATSPMPPASDATFSDDDDSDCIIIDMDEETEQPNNQNSFLTFTALNDIVSQNKAAPVVTTAQHGSDTTVASGNSPQQSSVPATVTSQHSQVQGSETFQHSQVQGTETPQHWQVQRTETHQHSQVQGCETSHKSAIPATVASQPSAVQGTLTSQLVRETETKNTDSSPGGGRIESPSTVTAGITEAFEPGASPQETGTDLMTHKNSEATHSDEAQQIAKVTTQSHEPCPEEERNRDNNHGLAVSDAEEPAANATPGRVEVPPLMGNLKLEVNPVFSQDGRCLNRILAVQTDVPQSDAVGSRQPVIVSVWSDDQPNFPQPPVDQSELLAGVASEDSVFQNPPDSEYRASFQGSFQESEAVAGGSCETGGTNISVVMKQVGDDCYIIKQEPDGSDFNAHEPEPGGSAACATNPQQRSVDGFYTCGFKDCSYTTLLPSPFEDHMSRRHHRDPRFPCSHCGSNEPSVYRLLQHLETHLPQDFTYGCVDIKCEFRSRKYEDVINHVLRTHPTARNYQCFSCGERFRSIQDLQSHVQENTLLVTECPYCAAKDTQEKRMLKHMSSAHPDFPRSIRLQKSFLCQDRIKHGWYGGDLLSSLNSTWPASPPSSHTVSRPQSPARQTSPPPEGAPSHRAAPSRATSQRTYQVREPDDQYLSGNETASSYEERRQAIQARKGTKKRRGAPASHDDPQTSTRQKRNTGQIRSSPGAALSRATFQPKGQVSEPSDQGAAVNISSFSNTGYGQSDISQNRKGGRTTSQIRPQSAKLGSAANSNNKSAGPSRRRSDSASSSSGDNSALNGTSNRNIGKQRMLLCPYHPGKGLEPRELIKSRIRRKLNYKPFICSICVHRTGSSSAFEKHTEKKHTSDAEKIKKIFQEDPRKEAIFRKILQDAEKTTEEYIKQPSSGRKK